MSEKQPFDALASALGPILDQAQHYARIAVALSSALPPDLRTHCQFACIRDGALVFLTDTAAWATKLRFHGPALVAVAVGALQLTVDRLTIRVDRSDYATDSSRRSPNPFFLP